MNNYKFTNTLLFLTYLTNIGDSSTCPNIFNGRF